MKHLFTVGSNSPERGREREKENVRLFHLDSAEGYQSQRERSVVMVKKNNANANTAKHLRTVDVVIELYHPPNLCT